MGILLRVMVVFLTLFSAFALTLGVLLFNKREVLKGRTQKLETKLIKLATQIEETDATIEEQNIPNYPERDASPCTATPVEQPETTKFWTEKYKPAMELQDQKTIDLNPKRTALMTYYKIDPVTQKIAVDQQSGFRITEGEGTMESVLTDLVSRATAQLGRLNETRELLSITRKELVETITELNTVKQDLRKALKTIVDKDAEIENLKGVIRQKDEQIAALNVTIQQKDDTIADLNKQIMVLKGDIEVRETTIKNQKRQIAVLEAEKIEREGKRSTKETSESPEASRVPPGDKGTVISVDGEWKFCVLSFNEDFLKELLGPELTYNVPSIHLLIRKPGEKGKFATKVRLMQLDINKKLGVANIMTDWQQRPVEPGDIVYY